MLTHCLHERRDAVKEVMAILLIRTRGQASGSGVGKRAGRPRYGYPMLTSTSDPEITRGAMSGEDGLFPQQTYLKPETQRRQTL